MALLDPQTRSGSIFSGGWREAAGGEAVAPFGGVGDSGTGSRLGGLGNLEAFTETQWLTIAGEVPPYPF